MTIHFIIIIIHLHLHKQTTSQQQILPYSLLIRINIIWKLISVKYTDLVTLVNGAPGIPKGNKQHNPDRLLKVSLLHLANPTTGFSKSKMDYLIFTENAPLEP